MYPYIDIHTHKTSKSNGSNIINTPLFNDVQNELLYSKGIHPWDIETTDIKKALEKLELEISNNNFIVLGEIGIDRAITTPINTQVEVFQMQLKIAESKQKPLIIHSVRSWSDLLSIRKEFNIKTPWIFHGFKGSLQTAQQLINAGCYLSFGEALITKDKTRQLSNKLPIEHIFLETDNSPEKIETVYENAANLRHICTDFLKEQLYRNFLTVFGDNAGVLVRTD